MWLLDHNIPHELAIFLRSKGIDCDTAQHRNWEKLRMENWSPLLGVQTLPAL